MNDAYLLALIEEASNDGASPRLRPFDYGATTSVAAPGNAAGRATLRALARQIAVMVASISTARLLPTCQPVACCQAA